MMSSDGGKDIAYSRLLDTEADNGFLNRAEHHVSTAKSAGSSRSLVKLFTVHRSDAFMRIFTALFYGLSSFLIIVANKVVLTSYKFPSFNFLGVGQMLATVLILSLAKSTKIVSFPEYSKGVAKKVFPLPLFYFGNLVCGLRGTQRLSLPMFTILRRFTILMTLIGEYYILHIEQSLTIVLSVVAMILGTVVAATDDLSFDLEGYASVLLNDFFTAGNGLCMKKKLDSKELGKYGLLYYNCLFMILPMVFVTWISNDFEKIGQFEHWSNLSFLFNFITSCVMGFVLMYSTILCTAYNSALTTTIVGCLKNILVTYLGLYIGGDYVYSFTNFVGLNISMIGSLIYSYFTFIENHKPSPSAK